MGHVHEIRVKLGRALHVRWEDAGRGFQVIGLLESWYGWLVVGSVG